MKGNHKSSYIRTETKLAAFTVNISLITLNEVFNLLKRDAGLIENPFSEIHKVKTDTESREAFADQELKLIFKKYSGVAISPIGINVIYPSGRNFNKNGAELYFQELRLTK